jgi:hypothetical protein
MAVKKNPQMQAAYKRLMELPLEGFMPRYIQFCLSQDIGGMLRDARSFVEQHFGAKNVAPRIMHNLAVMLLGLTLFQEYAIAQKIQMPKIEPVKILDEQLEEITGTKTGQVRSAVDQLIEELAIMADRTKKGTYALSSYNEPTPWHDRVRTNIDGKPVDVLAIWFNGIFPEFKAYAQRTKYEGDLLDKEGYRRQFSETDYVLSTSHTVNLGGKAVRAVCIGLESAKAAGIDLEGFGIA